MIDLSTRVREFAIGQKHEAMRLRKRAVDLAAQMPARTARAVDAGKQAGIEGYGPQARGVREINDQAMNEVDKLEAAATACEERAKVAERDPPGLLVRSEVEQRTPDFVGRYRSLITDCHRAGWTLTELPAELQPPPPPVLPPSPSAGWSNDRKQYRVWREDYNRPGFAYTRDMLRARETGAKVVVLD
jgi:hypothetical protein